MPLPTPINPGTVVWTGENPGILLKEDPDGPWSALAMFFRIFYSPAGRGSALMLYEKPDLAASLPIVVVPIPADVVRRVGRDVYRPAVIPAGTYDGQTEAAETAAIQNVLVTHEGVPQDVVYRMTKAMFEHLDQLVAAHVAARDISRDIAAEGLPVPLHPGAAAYYKEAGLLE